MLRTPSRSQQRSYQTKPSHSPGTAKDRLFRSWLFLPSISCRVHNKPKSTTFPIHVQLLLPLLHAFESLFGNTFSFGADAHVSVRNHPHPVPYKDPLDNLHTVDNISLPISESNVDNKSIKCPARKAELAPKLLNFYGKPKWGPELSH